MASKVRGFGVRAADNDEADVADVEVASRLHQPVYIDKAMLNEAVEATLESADPRHADSMRKLWAMDEQSDAAQAYFSDQVRRTTQVKFSELTRREHVVNEVLTQEECARMAEYAKEFVFTFRNVVVNEHGFFSARRVVDHEILLSKFPPATRIIDFGGSVQHHVRMGHVNTIVAAPFDMDIKDGMRAALTKLALRKLEKDPLQSTDCREMARSVLAGERIYHVPDSVQTTEVAARVSVAVHVYDVPIQDWPYMMERCGVRVHEGCMHFVNDFFSSDTGEFEYSGAYYEIDHKRDVFRMRVGRASAMWYEHKWSDFMRYGANQILHTDKARYSYQITERRQDTIFYRILRVDSAATPNLDQVYALPSVPMVEVKGFEVFPDDKLGGYGSRNQLVRRDYLFPHALWDRMVTFAASELDRGGLSYEKLFNYYRTVVPRQTINQVYVSGGQKVPLQEVPALVVMSGVVAYADSILYQRTIRARTDEIQAQRQLQDESTMYKGLCAFLDALVFAGRVALSPFASLGSVMSSLYLSSMERSLVMWRPQVRIRSLNVALITDHKKLGYSVSMPERVDFAGKVAADGLLRMLDLARADATVARDLTAMCGDKLSSDVTAKFAKSESTDIEGTTNVASTDVSTIVPGVSWHDKNGRKIRKTVYPLYDLTDTVRKRRLAIQEALDECLAEAKALDFTCARIAREVIVAGTPSEKNMRDRSEEFYNPDVWYVRNGVLTKSVMNPGSSNFTYSGVYLPGYDGERLQPVRDEFYRGPDSTSGLIVERVHHVLSCDYTGLALVVDGLKIFNGPAVADTLARVLDMDDVHLSFQLVCHQGPPGCGKTTTVARDGNVDTDVFLAPTRIAKQGLSDRLRDNHGIDAERAWMICRTLDSLLVNYAYLPDGAKQGFTSLLIDEYVLARSGKWLAAAALLGVQYVHAYGDNKQITHKPRAQVNRLFMNLEPQILEEEFLGYRNPAVILAAYNFVYNNEVRTASEVDGRVFRVKRFSDVTWMKSCRLMSMYQADKKLLNTISKQQASKFVEILVSTVHEAQGSDCDQVVLYNGELRKRPVEDAFYLYGLLEYCLVAMSRARVEFIYVKMSDEPDMITRMIDNSRDVRRIEAARDVASQGKSNILF